MFLIPILIGLCCVLCIYLCNVCARRSRDRQLQSRTNRGIVGAGDMCTSVVVRTESFGYDDSFKNDVPYDPRNGHVQSGDRQGSKSHHFSPHQQQNGQISNQAYTSRGGRNVDASKRDELVSPGGFVRGGGGARYDGGGRPPYQ